MSFRFYRQLNAMDCGPTCLRMIAKHYGRYFKGEQLRTLAGFTKNGVSLLGLSDTAEKIGFRTRGIRISIEQLREVRLPAILHWDQKHFVVLIEITKGKAKIADPSKGIIVYTIAEFSKHWLSSTDKEQEKNGIVLLLEPTPLFYEFENEEDPKLTWKIFRHYLKDSKWQLFQIFAALISVSLLSLIFPFLTQSTVDKGISANNLQYVIVVLIAQSMLIFSQTVIGFIRNRLLLRISNKLNIQILSDFWIKITRLPLSFFETHHTGDTLQRVGDHKTIQNFFTGTALSTVFSFFNFFIYAIVLVVYNVKIFFAFLIASSIYFLWIQVFLKIRRKLNYETFHLSAKENSLTLQLINGMQEIRLNNAEKQKRWEWENVQANIFKLSFKSLNYEQIQSVGATFISQMQGIAISFLVAKLVIDGQLTLGSMLAVQYVVGQLSSPIQQWISFIQSLQDAKISMERLNEIHQLDNEDEAKKVFVDKLPSSHTIRFSNVSFFYPSSPDNLILKNIDLEIPEKKITAIVGASGSGKTTLLKILLKIYETYDGQIKVGAEDIEKYNGIRFENINHKYWRSVCGSVLQDGYIFNDSIANNIALGEEIIDIEKLIESCTIANINDFITGLPNGFYTKLGPDGNGLSQGQKQRLMIARAIYKSPEYLFFDEATNALDANNEKKIIENLDSFFTGKTVVVVAHRLSTVKNANKIVVLNKGKIVEEGTHEELIKLNGEYFSLVKNQLELNV